VVDTGTNITGAEPSYFDSVKSPNAKCSSESCGSVDGAMTTIKSMSEKINTILPRVLGFFETNN
jgi:hypothetical protein